MLPADKHSFEQLRQAVEARFQEGHPHCHVPISEWKGQWIVDFQEDLLEKVQGRVSEKWFYTYFRKEEVVKLPRIDMLNLLSHYVGMENWAAFQASCDCSHVENGRDDRDEGKTDVAIDSRGEGLGRSVKGEAFVRGNGSGGPGGSEHGNEVPLSSQGSRRRRWPIATTLVGLSAIVALLFLFGFRDQEVEFRFVFMDAFTRSEVDHFPNVAYSQEEGQWKEMEILEGQGKLMGRRGEELMVAVSGGYCHPDTFQLELPVQGEEVPIFLKPDDFALMIHIFSRSDVKDWKKRREKLEGMISENAEIFQVDAGEQLGMEMYNKEEFIDKLTMPVIGLQNIEILETRHDYEGKINGLRFMQKKDK